MKLLVKKVRDIAPESDVWAKIGDAWKKCGEAVKKTKADGTVYLEIDFVLSEAPQPVTEAGIPSTAPNPASIEPNFEPRSPEQIAMDWEALKKAENKAEMDYQNYNK